MSVDPFEEDEGPAPEAHYIDRVFGPGGYLAGRFAGYQPRAGQVALARAVDRAITDTGHLMAEGPTGTGKSIGYAVPASYHASQHGRRVVIATANIALQEQLAQKDLPLLQEILPWKFSYALLKGRNNYLCVDRMRQAEAESLTLWNRPGQGSDDANEIEAIRDWAKETETGDVSELDFIPDQKIWRDFSRGSDECKGVACKAYDECFAYAAKRRARAADVIVTNYHMLFAHVAVRRATGRNIILPGFDVAILDEAHKAADIARDFFGFKVSAGTCARVARQLKKVQNDDQAQGLERKLTSAAQGFFDALGEYRRKGGYKVRLKEQLADSPIAVYWKMLDDYLDQAGYLLQRVATQQVGRDSKAEWTKIVTKAAETRFNIEAAMKLEDGEQHVYFLEEENGQFGARVTLSCRPIHVDNVLREEFFDGRPAGDPRPRSTYYADEDDGGDEEERRERMLRPKRTVVCTSATLSVNGGFSYIAKEMGCPEYASIIAESPFDWEKQCLFIVPENLPDPTDRTEFISAVPGMVSDVVDLAQGRTLALFTSYGVLNKTFDVMKKENRWRILKQGEMPRTKLVDEFRRDVASVLLGTESFWAGVDVQGESLSCVVIDKIPFPTPDDPVLDAIAARDKKWFFNYSVPRAVIQFKQGFGRLIRAVGDIGVVVLLDRRVIEKPYGREFIRSLPPASRSRNLAHIRDFLPPPMPVVVQPEAEVSDAYEDDPTLYDQPIPF